MDSYQRLEDRFRRLSRLSHALSFLKWDQLVMMPSGGNGSRSEAIAELTGLYHELLVHPETAELLGKVAVIDLDTPRRKNLLEMEREYQRAACLPSQLIKAQSRAGSQCEHRWRTQRQDNDWQGFIKYFQTVIDLSREEAQIRRDTSNGQFSSPYDALLDIYCTGESSEMIDELFNDLKKELPDLLARIVERQHDQRTILSGSFSEECQMRLNVELAKTLGFNFDSGRLDQSTHPFSTGVRGDHRITTRFRTGDFLDGLKATAHETGHTLYENGLPAQWDGLPAGRARNLSLHESQSLLFERQVFLSEPFLAWFTPVIHTHLPESSCYNHLHIRQAATQVRPGLIRMEADEVSYPLHVILRFEIERAMINSDLAPADLPEAWDEKMKSLLGLSTAGNYKDGCLQDTHWTGGHFGYFPAYTLGSLNSVQLFTTICREFPDWRTHMGAGNLDFLHQWLQTNIWQIGSLMDSQQIMHSATGENTNSRCFLAYIKQRYLDA